MSHQNDEVSENQILMEDFINSWARFSIDHPEIPLGEWLKTFSIMTGLAMHMGDMPQDNVGIALAQMNNVILDVFEKADQHVTKATVQ